MGRIVRADRAAGGLTPGALSAMARKLFPQKSLSAIFQTYRPWICPFEHLLPYVPTDATLLDIGCGAGLFIGLLACRGHVGASTGTDPSAKAIKMARAMAKGSGVFQDPGPTFLAGEGGELPADSYEGVAMIDVMHHVPPGSRKSLFAAAAARVRESGILLYKDMCCRPRWRAAANRFHDLVCSGEFVHHIPIGTIERWALDEGLIREVSSDFKRLWYGHELRVFRRSSRVPSPGVAV
jgi:2-polyprenyl-3-methyl-5-hydroxy-6-metoxy-1,4-benzoquinol methylase